MAPSRKKLVQAELPAAYRKVTKGSVEKPKPKTSTSSRRGIAKKQAAVRAPEIAPVLRDDGEEVIGSGQKEAICSVLTLQMDSSAFFTGPIKQIAKGAAVAEEFRRAARHYPVIRQSIVVRCMDGTPLLYFIKGGMLVGLEPSEQQELSAKSVSAIQNLIQDYPPIPPKPDDSRVDKHKEQKEKWKAMGKGWGRYHFIYQYAVGRTDLGSKIHVHGRPASKKRLNAIKNHTDATSWEHIQIARWISVLDPKKYEELHKRYQEVGSDGLKHLYQGQEACQSGLVVLANLAVGPHKDKNDARDNWTTTNCWGSFAGGFIVFPDLGIKIAQEPGDLILSHAAVLTHFLEEVEEGERFCHVRFTKKNILQPPAPKRQLDIACPFPDCPKSQPTKGLPSWGGMKKHLEGPAGQKKRLAAIRAATGAYHFLEDEEAVAMMNKAEGAYASADTEVSEMSDDQ